MYSIEKLNNGLTVVYVPMEHAQSVTLELMVPVGSRYESNKDAGMAHFIEHMLFKGTKKRKSSRALSLEIDRYGAAYNAYTGTERTGYYIKIDAAYTKIACDILSDMLFQSTLTAKSMKSEKTVILEEIKMYHDNPIMHIGDLADQVIYVGALARDIAGTKETVSSFTRAQLLAFKQKYYQPKNMILAVAGKVDDKTKQLVSDYFGKAKNTGPVSKWFAPGVFSSAKKKDRIVVDRRPLSQAQLMLLFPAISGEDRKRAATLALLRSILCGSMSSRLFVRIREQLGLVYSISVLVAKFRDIGDVGIKMGLDPKNINKAIAAVKEELLKIVEKGVTAKELRDAKTASRGSKTLAFEDSGTQAEWYAGELLFYPKHVMMPEDAVALLEKVTREDIQKLAKQIFKMNQLRVAVIGDVDTKDIVF